MASLSPEDASIAATYHATLIDLHARLGEETLRHLAEVEALRSEIQRVRMEAETLARAWGARYGASGRLDLRTGEFSEDSG